MLRLGFLALLPAAFAAPAARGVSCNDVSRDFEWSATDIAFRAIETYSTPSHVIPKAWISFQLENPATQTVTECSAYSDWAYSYFVGDRWFQCNSTEDVRSTQFSYVLDTGRLNVTQTWTCYDGPDPIRYTASGTATQKLPCTGTDWKNPNWTTGTNFEVITRNCGPVDLTIPLSEISAVA